MPGLTDDYVAERYNQFQTGGGASSPILSSNASSTNDFYFFGASSSWSASVRTADKSCALTIVLTALLERVHPAVFRLMGSR